MEGIFKPRKFQADNLRVAMDIGLQNASVKRVMNDITPGGGKSAIPVIYAAKLIPGFADKIAWLVPRQNLRRQGAEAFEDNRMRSWLNHSMRVREASNNIDPSHGTQGYVSTFQAVSWNPDLHRHEFERHRYILVLDEPHHIIENKDWHRAIAPLVDRAKLVILMTGTLGRHDGRRVAFVKYQNRDLLGECVETESCDDYRFIRYARADALEERAIIPIEFCFSDLAARWEKKGERWEISSFDDATVDDVGSDALRVALETEFAFQLMDKAAGDWLAYRREHPRAQLIVTAHSQTAAKQYAKRLRDKFGVVCGIATNDQGETAQREIDNFREGRLAALSTVAMAHEGMDAPSAVFVACLSYYRSRPFLEQLFARATRFDAEAGSWKQQRAHIYLPDDDLMRRIVDQIEEEEEPFLKAFTATTEGGNGHEGERQQFEDVIPLQGAVAGWRASEMGGDSITREQTKMLQEVLELEGAAGKITPMELYRILQRSQEVKLVQETHILPPMTVVQEEKRKRDYIEAKTRMIDSLKGKNWGTTNREIWNIFKKDRQDMTLDELDNVIRFLDHVYGDIGEVG